MIVSKKNIILLGIFLYALYIIFNSRKVNEGFYSSSIKFFNINDFERFIKQKDYFEVFKYFNILEIIVKSNFNINNSLENKPIAEKYLKSIKELNYALENYQYFNEKGSNGNLKLHNLPLFNYKVNPEYKVNLRNLFLNNLTYFYKQNLVEFTNEQQSLLRGVISEIDRILINALERIPIWNLVLYKNNIDWDFPYTIGSVIFMTQRRLQILLDKYTNGDNDDMSGIKITLVHEYLHILQRKNVKAFQSFYEIFWGFKPIPEGKRNNIYGDVFLKTYGITNPDGNNGEYYVEHNGEKYTPFLMLDPKNIKNHLPMLVKLDNDFNVLHDEKSKKQMKGEVVQNVKIPIMYNISDMSFYKKHTYGVGQNYHPNEVFATLVSTYLIDEGLVSSQFRENASEATKLLSKLENY